MYVWDKENVGHIALHGVVPVEVEQVLENDPIDIEAQQHDNEERFVQVGVTNALRVLVVVTTWRGDLVRPITAFEAPPQLQKFYFAEKGEDYGP